VQHADFRSAESGHAHQIEQSARGGFAQPVEVARLAGFDQFADYRQRRGSDALRVLQLAGLQERKKVVGAEGQNRAGCALIRAGIEPGCTAELEQGSDLREDMRCCAGVHPLNVKAPVTGSG